MKQARFRPIWLWIVLGLMVVTLVALLVQSAPMSQALASRSTGSSLELTTVPAKDTSQSPAGETVDEEQPVQLALVADAPASDNCVACHTNKELLQQLAEEPIEVVSELASGEG
ncbi:MAG: hypothetical protein U9R25_01445 [Chloroflexota bacterium]|nr:hypothetical protein [Chloroflexota bacterium]